MTHTHLRPRNVNLCWQLDLFWVRGDDKWSSYAVVCLKWASFCRTHWLLTCGHRLSLACSDGEYKSYIKLATLLLLSGAGAWVARNFRVFVTEVGEICWKARDTRSLVITKAQAWTLKMQWSGSRNRVRFDYILEKRFGMFDPKQANSQLLSSLAILFLVPYVACTAPLAGLCESPNIKLLGCFLGCKPR